MSDPDPTTFASARSETVETCNAVEFRNAEAHAAGRIGAPFEAAQSLKGDVSVLQLTEMERVL
jgi:hypothetical protein